MRSSKFRCFLWLLLVLVLPLQTYVCVLWIQKHGFWEGIRFWLVQGALDPMYLTAEIDFTTLMLVVGIGMGIDFWGQRKGGFKTIFALLILAAAFCFYPSICTIIYLLFIRKPETSTSALRRPG